jgi:2-polyprenyl-6-methoxyphenol hydroxylase-like FAD-dependent oxidoreductase
MAQRVTILGAGPAGTIAALLHARRGWNVTLVEQHRFPRDKVCGECLSALGIEVLARCGLRDTIAALGPVELRHATLVPPRGAPCTLALPRPMWGLSRSALDIALLDAATAAGTRLLQPCRCEELVVDPPPSLRVRDLAANELFTLAADFVLLADGRASFAHDPPRSTGDLGVKAHFVGVDDAPADGIRLFGLAGHYVGLAPIEADRWNLAMSVPAAKVKARRGDLDALFATIRRENPRLADAMRSSRRVGAWLTCPLPRFAVRRRWPERIIPLGNAAAAVEPIGGEGMGLAMRSAELAADELCSAAETGRPVDAPCLRQQMRQLWRPRRFGCRAGAVLLSRPSVARVMARLTPPLAPVAIKFVGK